MQAAAQIEAMDAEQQGLKAELHAAEQDNAALKQRLLDSDISAPRQGLAPLQMLTLASKASCPWQRLNTAYSMPKQMAC